MPFLRSLKTRELTPEIMDDLSLDAQSHIEALQGLEKINSVSFAAAPIWAEIKRYFDAGNQKPVRVLDIACGGGDLARDLALRARKENLPLIIEGCDFNPRTVEYAREQTGIKKIPVSYFLLDALQTPIPERFEIIINSLFLHHLTTDELSLFFKKLASSPAKLIIISDLKRSIRGWLLAHLGGRIFSKSPVVHVDGPRSVRAALTAAEILRLTNAAGFSKVHIRSVWPMRYILTLTVP